MAKYKCSICGHVFCEEAENMPFTELGEDWCCPVCTSPKYLFEAEDGGSAAAQVPAAQEWETSELDYPAEFRRPFDEKETRMADIHEMAATGRTIIAPMRTQLPIPAWDEILIMGAQLDPMPLLEDAAVSTATVIGKGAKQPMELDMPVYITHMSTGALSPEGKVALARGSAAAKTAMCSGEGGIYPPEREAAYKYIFEYVPNQYSVTDENLKNADAIEIKIGQGTKPGMGGHLPGGKVTEEIAAVRGVEPGKDVISPSKFPGIDTKEDLKALVEELRARSGGRPIGIKVAAGHIERDLDVIAFAGADFVTIDGRGGATGASPKLVKDAASVPTLYALARARRHMNSKGMEMQLVITGGLRVSSDFAKALAMGADAVAIGTAAMIAAACQQYRICHTGTCPMGLATMDPEIRARFDVDKAARRVENFLQVVKSELMTWARQCGKDDVHALGLDDICTTSADIAAYTDVAHV